MAQSTPTSASPLTRLMHEQARTIEAWHRADEAYLDAAVSRKPELETLWNALGERILELEEAATHERAVSLPEAAYQSLVLRDARRDLSGPDDAERRMDHLIGSIIASWGTSVWHELAAAVVEYYGPVERDPLGLVG